MNQKFSIQSLGCCAQSSEPFSGPAHRHMHLQAVEVALLARDVASKRSGAFFRGIEPTATDANIVAGRHRQRVHDVRLIGVALLEDLSQQFEQYPSERGFTDADAAVEAALAELALRLEWGAGGCRLGASRTAAAQCRRRQRKRTAQAPKRYAVLFWPTCRQ